jgi:hypothetical protein
MYGFIVHTYTRAHTHLSPAYFGHYEQLVMYMLVPYARQIFAQHGPNNEGAIQALGSAITVSTRACM